MLAFGIRESTTTTGTGLLTTASVSGYPTFDAVFGGSNRPFFYSILDSNNLPIEHGVGHMSMTNTMQRDQILATYVSGTYNESSPTAVSLAAGTKYVICAGGPATECVSPYLTTVTSRGVNSILHTVGEANIGPAGANTLMIYSYYLNFGILCTGLKFRIAGTAASNNMRVGMYDIGTTGRPNNLLFDTGDISTASPGVQTYALGTALYLRPGPYFFLTNSNNSGSYSLTGAASALPGFCIMGGDNNISPILSGYVGSFTYAAMVTNPISVSTIVVYGQENSSIPYFFLTV